MKKNKVYAVLETVDGFDTKRNHESALVAIADSEITAMKVAAEAMSRFIEEGSLREADTAGFQFLLKEDRKTWVFEDFSGQNESGRRFSWLIQPRIVQSFS